MNFVTIIIAYLILFSDFADALKMENECPNNCNGNGYCRHRVCHCFDGFGGMDCSIETLHENVWIDEENVEVGEWHYYKMYISGLKQPTGIRIYYRETNTHYGDGDIYVGRNYLPTKYKYDYRDISALDHLHIDIDDPKPGHWFIGIYGLMKTTYALKYMLFYD